MKMTVDEAEWAICRHLILPCKNCFLDKHRIRVNERRLDCCAIEHTRNGYLEYSENNILKQECMTKKEWDYIVEHVIEYRLGNK